MSIFIIECLFRNEVQKYHLMVLITTFHIFLRFQLLNTPFPDIHSRTKNVCSDSVYHPFKFGQLFSDQIYFVCITQKKRNTNGIRNTSPKRHIIKLFASELFFNDFIHCYYSDVSARVRIDKYFFKI